MCSIPFKLETETMSGRRGKGSVRLDDKAIVVENDDSKVKSNNKGEQQPVRASMKGIYNQLF